MIINGFGGQGGSLESGTVVKTVNTTLTPTNPVSGASDTPPSLGVAYGQGSSSAATYRIIFQDSKNYITTDDIFAALKIYHSVQLFTTVNSITPPTITMTAYVSGNTGTAFTWPLGCMVVFGYGGNQYSWGTDYYRMCTATNTVKGSVTTTIQPTSYTSMTSYGNTAAVLPVMNRIGLSGKSGQLIVNGGGTSLASSSAPEFHRGEISFWVCWDTSITPVPSGVNFSRIDSLSTSGGSISLTFTLVGY